MTTLDDPFADMRCANHPGTPTRLRCYKCNKPICSKCAMLTPVGYKCKSCTSAQQQIFETALWYDYAIALALTAILAGVAGFFVSFLGFFVIVLAPVAGGLIAEAVRWATQRRRGRWLPAAAVAGFVLGGLALMAVPLANALFSLLVWGGLNAGLGFLLNLLWPLVYTVLGASTLYARLRGIAV